MLMHAFISNHEVKMINITYYIINENINQMRVFNLKHLRVVTND